jgi:hypothetical protein
MAEQVPPPGRLAGHHAERADRRVHHGVQLDLGVPRHLEAASRDELRQGDSGQRAERDGAGYWQITTQLSVEPSARDLRNGCMITGLARL